MTTEEKILEALTQAVIANSEKLDQLLQAKDEEKSEKESEKAKEKDILFSEKEVKKTLENLEI